MAWLFAVLLVALIGGIVMVAAGRGESLAPAETDEPSPILPEGALTPDDVRRVRFSTALRGYRADEVDRVLERLALQLSQDGRAVSDRGTPEAASPRTQPLPPDDPASNR